MPGGHDRPHATGHRAVAGAITELEPLSDEDAGKLLAERDARFSTDQGLTQTVIRKTGGNPLFLEEVAALAGRTRAQPGELMPDEGGLDRLTLVIPERVESLIADRLAELPNRQRRLLELCAVIGDEVPLDLLRPLADGGSEDIERRLERLLSKHLVYATDRDSTRYSFRHSIIRDVCINGMLIATRRSLHVRILELLARTVESRHDARIVDLCYHAINAERWDRAVVHLREAADAATESFAFKAAVFYLKRALDVTTKLPPGEASDRTRLDLLLSLRGLLGATDEFVEANRLLDEAEAIAMRLGDPDYQARILAARSPALSGWGDRGGAAEAGRRSRLMALKSGDRSLLAAANFFLGQTHFSRGELARAEEALSENARLLQAGTIEWRPAAMGTLTVFNPAILAAVHALQGRVDAAEHAASAALEAARLTGRPYDLGLAHLYDGFRLLHRRSTDAANAAFARAFEHAQERGLGQLLPPILIGLGQALLQTGDVPTAIGRLNEGRELSGTRGRSMMLIWASAALAWHRCVRRDRRGVGAGAAGGRPGGAPRIRGVPCPGIACARSRAGACRSRQGSGDARLGADAVERHRHARGNRALPRGDIDGPPRGCGRRARCRAPDLSRDRHRGIPRSPASHAGRRLGLSGLT